jgi:hypothetical protein
MVPRRLVSRTLVPRVVFSVSPVCSAPLVSLRQPENCYLGRFSALHGASQALIMKNLAISGTWRFALPGSDITTAIVDVDNARLWIATERLDADADVEVDIYKKGLPDDPYEMEDVSFPLVFPSPSIGPAGRCRFTAECRWRPLNSSRNLYHVQADSFRILPHKWLLSGVLLEKRHLSSSRAEEISCRRSWGTLIRRQDRDVYSYHKSTY